MSYAIYEVSPYPGVPFIEPVHTVVTPNSNLVVTVAETKDHLSYPVEDSAIDTELTGLILAAQRQIELVTGINLLPTVWRAEYPKLSAAVQLRKRPFQSIQSIEYVDSDSGEITTVDTSLYHVANDPQMMATAYLGKGKLWPSAADRADAYRITYTSGWTSDAVVPRDIKTAVLMTVAKLDSSRGDVDDASDSRFATQINAGAKVIPNGALALMGPYKLVEVYAA